MSRRYGRNQKRRAREALAQSHGALVKAKQEAHSAAVECARLTFELSNVRQVLGVNWVGLDPQHIRMALADIERARHGAYYVARPMGEKAVMSLATVRSVLHPLDNAIHFRASLDGEVVGYALSQQALFNVPEDYLARQVGLELGNMLVRLIREARQPKRNKGD